MGPIRLLVVVLAMAACGAELSEGTMPAPGTGPGPASVDPGGGGRGGGGGGGGNGGNGTSILTPTQYMTKLAMTQCDQLFACRPTYPAAAGDFAMAYGNAVTDCYAFAIAAFETAELEAEVSKQRITFDGAAAASCILGFGEPDCSTFWTHDWLWGQACYHVFAGTVPLGGTCGSDYSCAAPGAYCDEATERCATAP
ncbi:MAG: hypothetical protein H0T46_26990 [Deltaproteobacteria bacterium]|nr:hypothetical protein [Deltaproteobacteria bacterium]